MGYKSSIPNIILPDKEEVINKTPNPAVAELARKITEDGHETYLDRFKSQQPQCGFGLKGVCCRMCQWGPCTISNKSPRGICGRSQDEIVISNLIRMMVAGLAAHGRHAHEIILTVKGVAEGKINLRLKGTQRIMELAGILNLDLKGKNENQLAGEIADILLEDLGRMEKKSIRLLEAFAPADRKEIWENLDIDLEPVSDRNELVR